VTLDFFLYLTGTIFFCFVQQSCMSENEHCIRQGVTVYFYSAPSMLNSSELRTYCRKPLAPYFAKLFLEYLIVVLLVLGAHNTALQWWNHDSSSSELPFIFWLS
jgi:hypothetical protein